MAGLRRRTSGLPKSRRVGQYIDTHVTLILHLTLIDGYELMPEKQSESTRLADPQGCDSAAVGTAAVEGTVSYEGWFMSEVEKGLAAADDGESTDHEAVRAIIDSRYPAFHESDEPTPSGPATGANG